MATASASNNGHSSGSARLPRPSRKEVPTRLPQKSSLPTYRPAAESSPVSKRGLPTSDTVTRKPVPPRHARTQAVALVAPAKSNAASTPDAFSAGAVPLDAMPVSTTPTPSLVSGSSVSTQESPRAHMLRRKPSVISHFKMDRHAKINTGPNGQPVPHVLDVEPALQTPLYAPFNAPRSHHEGQSVKLPSSLPLLPSLRTDESVTNQRSLGDVRPAQRPTPVSEVSVTPSIPHTESPSAFSQVTTATSMTSYSPAISASPRIGPNFGFSPDRKRSQASHNGRSEHASPRGPPRQPFAHPFFSQSESLLTSTAHESSAAQMGESLQPAPAIMHADADKTSYITKPSPVHPPELAHLNAEPSNSGTSALSESPPRPSRVGTENVLDACLPQPIVQSNLPRLNTSVPQPRSRASMEDSSSNSRRVSALTIARAQVAADAKEKALPKPPQQADPRVKSPASSTDAGSQAPKTKSRFGLFSRRPKPEGPDTTVAASKSARKGPAAGTGHEGYGKAATKVRSGSSSSQNSTVSSRFGFSKRKSSGSSSKTDLDDFLQDRLSPVYIRGDGSAAGSQPRGSGSVIDESPFFSDVSSPDSPEMPGSALDLQQDSIDAQLSQSLDRQPVENQLAKTSSSLNTEVASHISSASTPSTHKRLAKSKPSVSSKLKQLKSSSETNLPSLGSSLNRPSTSAGVVSVTQSSTPVSAKNAKSGWKWNLFHRTKAESTSHDSTEPSEKSLAVPAHYLSSEDEAHFDADDLDTIMREAAAQADHQLGKSALGPADNRISVLTDFEDDGEAMEVPHPAEPSENAMSSAPRPSGQMSEEAISQLLILEEISDLVKGSKDTSARPSRLSSVGRIPKVVSKRDRVRKLPDTSFSRPFLNAQPRPSVPSISPPASERSSHLPPGFSSQRSSQSLGVPQQLSLKTRSNEISATLEFLDFDKRKNSDISYSSSAGTTYFPTASIIAHGPGRGSQVSTDETWPEFDDLIDHVLTPTESSSSPRRMSKALSDLNEDVLGVGAGKARLNFPRLQSGEQFPQPPAPLVISPSKDVSRSLDKVADAIVSWDNVAKPLRSSSVYSLTSQQSNSGSLKHKRSTSLPDPRAAVSLGEALAEKGKSHEAEPDQENMALFRFRVLMTSKWLSFGRLLVSPVHKELGNNPDDRVLIVDGLGNRDWSYYCAVSYPNTQIYSLSPASAANSSSRSSLGGFGNLPNHRNFTYSNLGTDFPFPKSFFTAVVLRFPCATSEAIQRLNISECKRVLRPGGYLEISTLDLDLTNMGPVARRAVRSLKLRMQAANPDVLLNSASDHIQGLLHRRGFENLNRCFVGVPAAGAISSIPQKPDMDFSELAEDHSREGDEHITRLVAQVGRWWYSRCYESVAGSQTEVAPSMWSGEDLLKECEEMSTTFKLLICFAQKPMCAKRRTVSL